MEILVRTGTAADAAALGEFRGDLDGFVGWMVRHADSHVPFLAEVDGTIAGTAWLLIAERVPNADSPRRLFGDVQSVQVRNELRNRGIGTALMAAVLEEARRRGLEHVIVHSSHRAVSLYERAGFRHERECLYWEPVS